MSYVDDVKSVPNNQIVPLLCLISRSSNELWSRYTVTSNTPYLRMIHPHADSPFLSDDQVASNRSLRVSSRTTRSSAPLVPTILRTMIGGLSAIAKANNQLRTSTLPLKQEADLGFKRISSNKLIGETSPTIHVMPKHQKAAVAVRARLLRHLSNSYKEIGAACLLGRLGTWLY